MLNKKIIFSGVRPTGKMHLGNYHGALKNWVKLQHEYNCYFCVADLHALTTHYGQSKNIAADVRRMVEDWLSIGLDPKNCKMFIQSKIPEHAELHLLLSMITPLGWLERVPTYKNQQQKLKNLDLSTYGFLGYPLLQSADVLLYKAEYVPVGEDQIFHVELMREVARRFNHMYGREKIILPEPQHLLTDVPKLPGIDGQKMSKSYNNVIEIGEDKLSIEKKIKIMITDPARIKRTDCGDPDKCPVWQLHKVYSNQEVTSWVDSGCRSAQIGCIDCKFKLIDAIEKEQQPIREKYNMYKKNNHIVDMVIEQGIEEASCIAKKTLLEVKDAMGINFG